ncbi:6-phosphogluconolactonase, eukaryotic type [hydrothermal vent metagenome]|uniref:6-phosphogluconolactonase, eukaryotic type n=1 Tax=hydrothermal vent metagenome TaxID=652676 RepID=A0A3B0UTQ9_9ZZZZ
MARRKGRIITIRTTNPFTLQVFANDPAFNQAATRLLTTLAQDAVAQNGRFSIALSGGGTPAGVYQLWGERPFVDEMPWHNTHLFWSDERLVPPTDTSSNYAQVASLLLKNAPIPPENIHRAKGELEMEAAVADYTHQLQTFATRCTAPIFDVVLLGMGSDGHTASLFPNSPLRQPELVVGVTADYNGRPAQRISFTPLLINCARHVIFLVKGSGKKETLQKVLYGPYQPDKLPAQRIQPISGTLTWLVGEAVAS